MMGMGDGLPTSCCLLCREWTMKRAAGKENWVKHSLTQVRVVWLLPGSIKGDRSHGLGYILEKS